MLLVFPTTENHPIGNGHNQCNQYYRKHSSETDDHTHRHPEQVSADNHRQDAQSRRTRSQENRPHTPFASLFGRFLQRHTIGKTQFFRIFKHNDSVPDYDADQRNESQHGGHREIEAENPKPEKGSEKAEGTQYDGQNGKGYLLEMEDQEEKEHQHRSDERKRNLWAYGPVHIVQSAELHTHPFRQVQVFQELLHGTGGCGLALAETHIRTDYDDRLSIHAGEGFRFPLGTELSHLTQRYRNSRYGRGHKGIGYVFVIRPLAVILRIEIYRNYGFTLPDAAQREGTHLAGQGKIHQGTVHAHTQSLILVKFHRNGRNLIVRVGVYPFKHIKASHIIPYGIRNLTHLLIIFPENLHFHRSGHSLIVHLLEMHNRFRKPVLVARLHLL